MTQKSLNYLKILFDELIFTTKKIHNFSKYCCSEGHQDSTTVLLSLHFVT